MNLVDAFTRFIQTDFSSFVRTALESNKISRVGESAPLEGRWVLRGLTEAWGRGRSTDVERTNRQTGMHRPWGDFCVYRSALTPEAEAENEHGVQRAKGMRAPSVLCLPFPLSLAELRRPFFSILLVLRSVKVRFSHVCVRNLLSPPLCANFRNFLSLHL